ncbi:c-type cytochrome [Leeia sp. TBRC 13508]|uniref:C-type cytochrome n=1 Tax=Leeia speluncae TaxID=2884804 RepID=A0ABS8D5C6_9NEIS|nr:c-type cytochrome [Leeia speluncae]MCB6183398.1 c-type cytochrome [Leeia speluncae]
MSTGKSNPLGLVVAGIVVAVAAVFLLAKLVISYNAGQANPDDMTAEAINARVKQVGELDAGEVVAAGAMTGKMVYEQVCFSCHKDGLIGAPKLGDAAAWGPRIAQGFDTLVKHAVEGFNGKMPAKGGNANLTDQEVARAVAYMANSGGAKFTEPKVEGVASGESKASEGAASK